MFIGAGADDGLSKRARAGRDADDEGKGKFSYSPPGNRGAGGQKNNQKKRANHIGLVEIHANPYYIDRHLTGAAN